MVVATLSGHAVAMPNVNNWADHTYVLSDAGDVWPCFGGASGGLVICQGSGDIALARCLAGSTGEAGINYGTTGVCHQTANRILYPSGKTVSNAGGYMVSFFAYHTYGRGKWQELPACLAATGNHFGGGGPSMPDTDFHAPDTGYAAKTSGGGKMSRQKREDFDKRVAEIYADMRRQDGTTPETYISSANAEIRAMAESFLGSRIRESEIEELVTIRANLHLYQDKIFDKKENRDMTESAALEAIVAETVSAMERCEAVLGHERFTEMFQIESPREAANIFNMELAGR